MTNHQYQYSVADVRKAAENRWGEIFSSLAPVLREAMDRPGKHVACPVHGGTNGFRLYPNYKLNGAGVCNTCGNFKDGFALLQWLNGMAFGQVVAAVGRFLNLKRPGQVVAEEKDGRVFVGKLVFVGQVEKNGRSFFAVKICEETAKRVLNLSGKDLLRAINVAGLRPGDRAKLTLISTQTVENQHGQFQFKLWGAEKLPTLEEEKAAAKERQDRDTVIQNGIAKLWSLAQPIDAEESALVRTYLSGRAIELKASDVADLRFLPQAHYKDAAHSCWLPAMVAAVRDPAGKLIALHRTFLSEVGRKASVSVPKKLTPLPSDATLNGAAIRLGQAGAILGVAEGIETALSVFCATGLPTWSTICANGMEQFVPPAGVRVVLIWADKDRTEVGAKAAKALAHRLRKMGILGVVMTIEKAIPEAAKGLDWNDILCQDGAEAFPVVK